MPNLVAGIEGNEEEDYLISGPASISDIDVDDDSGIPDSVEGVESYDTEKSYTI
jgi:hypothetical protein